MVNVLDDANANLTAGQKALLFQHQRLGHLHMEHLQQLYRPSTANTALPDCVDAPACLTGPSPRMHRLDPPKCLACAASKTRRQPTPARRVADDPTRRLIMNRDVLEPGQMVLDQYLPALIGLVVEVQLHLHLP